jgi:hypothetical protein
MRARFEGKEEKVSTLFVLFVGDICRMVTPRVSLEPAARVSDELMIINYRAGGKRRAAGSRRGQSPLLHGPQRRAMGRTWPKARRKGSVVQNERKWGPGGGHALGKGGSV